MLEKCAFCGADRNKFFPRTKTKHYEVETKHYELESGVMVTVELKVMECLNCKKRWIRYFEIEDAVKAAVGDVKRKNVD